MRAGLLVLRDGNEGFRFEIYYLGLEMGRTGLRVEGCGMFGCKAQFELVID